MIFSASAVTADSQYGHSYIFLARQAVWLVAGIFGMFALMRTDYRKLREPAVIYTTVCVVLVLLAGKYSAFGTRQAGGDSVSCLVLGFAAAQRGAHGIQSRGFSAHHFSCDCSR